MTTVAAGSSQTFTAAIDGTIFTVTVGGGGAGNVLDERGQNAPIGPSGLRRGFGPLDVGQSITVSMQAGSALVTGGVDDGAQIIDPTTGAPLTSGGVALSVPTSNRKIYANEEVIFLYNGNNPNDTNFPLTGLMLLADIPGAGTIDFINMICTAGDAPFRAAQLVVFTDGKVTPDINMQLSHFGVDYQPAGRTLPLTVGNQRMRLKLGPAAAGTSQAHAKFGYKIPFSNGAKVYLYVRQPITKWWTEVAVRPGVTSPMRLKSKSNNSNGPSFARGGTTGFAAAASSFLSPIDGVTACAIPSFLNATTTTLKDGSINLLDLPAGTVGTLAGFCYSAFNTTADSFSYLETNPALFTAAQKAAGINANSIAANYHSTGTEDFLGASFYGNEGIGSYGATYISQLATTDNLAGPGAAFATNFTAITDFLDCYENGIEFTDGAYLTLVQSATNIVADPANAVSPNTTTQTSISTGVSLSFATLYYERV